METGKRGARRLVTDAERESRGLLVRVAWSTQDSKGAQTIDQMNGSDEANKTRRAVFMRGRKQSESETIVSRGMGTTILKSRMEGETSMVMWCLERMYGFAISLQIAKIFQHSRARSGRTSGTLAKSVRKPIRSVSSVSSGSLNQVVTGTALVGLKR
jgi:hypothetical protein